MKFEVKEMELGNGYDRRVMIIKSQDLVEEGNDFYTLRAVIKQFTSFLNPRNPFILTEEVYKSIMSFVQIDNEPIKGRLLLVGWQKRDTTKGAVRCSTVSLTIYDGVTYTTRMEFQQPIAFDVCPSIPTESYSVAIDGPAAAGKSTIAKCIAQTLGFVYIDTGAMYRAVGLACIDAGISCTDEDAVNAFLPSINIDIINDGEQKIMLNGVDVSKRIRTNEVSMAASNVSKHCQVRLKLVKMQQEMAAKGKVVMEGRDIGTVVLPNANVKVFLTADVHERAKRRCIDLYGEVDSQKWLELQDELEARDINDTTRENSPLRCTFDAYRIDTTDMDITEVVYEITSLIKWDMNKN